MKKNLLLLVFLAFTISLKAQTPPVDTTNHQIYIAVQVPPSFMGGQAAFNKFLDKTIQYPATDRQNNVQGRVYLNFIVEKDGSLTDIKVLRTPSQSLAVEAIRVMQQTPKWNPGIQSGYAVRVSYTVPINFAL